MVRLIFGVATLRIMFIVIVIFSGMFLDVPTSVQNWFFSCFLE